ncbi:hypothetical protein BJ875DRAFT_442684 [Amylocarpus encephaloides]|uniref:FAD-binding FR-type domain-containing protein n=1 Tax=Amylocarpus encephaloides TaxID=45428 RepID=A0A9P7YG33_9HELO|nr:hypothetical protein BJ875DRAFT_442684 [Amylocarpus encephaloides]
MNIVASWCGLSLGAYARIHEWLGIVVIVKGLVHTVAGAASQKLDLHTTSGIITLAAGAVIGALLLSLVALTLFTCTFGRRNHKSPKLATWWYRDTKRDVIVLIVKKRKGFTRDLFYHASNNVDLRSGMRAIVEGPYEKELDLELYDTVLLFTTGMGISSGVINRRIALFWELNSENTLYLAFRSR